MKPHTTLLPGDSIGHKFQTWFAEIDTTRVVEEDLFRPQYWVNCLLLKKNDLIRCVAKDGSYDFYLKVNTHRVAPGKNAVTVSLFPKLSAAIVAASEGDAATEMVPTFSAGKPVPRVDEIYGRNLWRLVGFAGEQVGDLHQSSAEADRALEEYLTAHGITTEVDGPPVDIKTGEIVRQGPIDPARPNQYARSVLKKNAKREGRLAKQRANDEANKARTAERLAAEAAG